MGWESYVDSYRQLGDAVANAVRVIEGAGMQLIHKRFRAGGSTVISVEDPSGLMSKKMGKRGHYVARIFGVAPEFPDRCQTGWQLSTTPHALRRVPQKGKGTGKEIALDVFLRDVVAAHKEVQQNSVMQKLWNMVPENSIIACLVGGNMDPYLLPLLQHAGPGRALTRRVVRRFFTASMDSGVVHTGRHQRPIAVVMKRFLLAIVVVVLTMRARVAQRLMGVLRWILGFRR